MAEGVKITPADLDMEEFTPTTERKYENMGLKEAREIMEKELITKALSATGATFPGPQPIWASAANALRYDGKIRAAEIVKFLLCTL